MSDFSNHVLTVAISAMWGWYMRGLWIERQRQKRTEFYTDIKDMASRIDTIGKFGVSASLSAHYVRRDGAMFRLTVEKVEQ